MEQTEILFAIQQQLTMLQSTINVVLVLMGLLFGCGVGIGLASVIIRIIEIGARRYVRLPDPLACVYSCVMVAVFATIVNIIALRRINHLNLTNVNAN